MTAKVNRLGGGLLVLAFVVIAASLWVRDFPEDQRLPGLSSTIYPWWLWILVAVGLVSAVMVMLGAKAAGSATRAAPAAAAVAAAQLAGSGFVAVKHWEPARGMGGTYGGNVPQLERLALVVGVAGLVAVAVGVGLLVANGDLPQRVARRLRVLSCGVGALIVVALPLVLAAASPYMRDLTSWGAVGLVYAGPWGVAIAVAGWLSHPAATAALGTVALSAGLALTGPQMTSLVLADPAPAFAATLLLTLLVLVLRGRSITVRP